MEPKENMKTEKPMDVSKKTLAVAKKTLAVAKKPLAVATISVAVLAYGVKLFSTFYPRLPSVPGVFNTTPKPPNLPRPTTRSPQLESPPGTFLDRMKRLDPLEGLPPFITPKSESAAELKQKIELFVERKMKWITLGPVRSRSLEELGLPTSPGPTPDQTIYLEIKVETDAWTEEQLRELVGTLQKELSGQRPRSPERRRFKLTGIDYFGGSIEITDTVRKVVHKISFAPFVVVGGGAGITLLLTSSSDDKVEPSEPTLPDYPKEQSEEPAPQPQVILVRNHEEELVELAANSIDMWLSHSQKRTTIVFP